MRKVVLFLHPTSKYGVLGQMIHELQAAFERLGIQAVIREFLNASPAELTEQVRQDNPDCTWGINTFVDEHCFFFPLGIPHVRLGVDAVTYSDQETFSQQSTVSLFVDKTSCDLFSVYSDNPVHWFPHGIAKEVIDYMRSSPIIPMKDRPYDVSLIGSFLDHRRAKTVWEDLFAPSDVIEFVSIAERSLEDPSVLLLAEALAYIEETPSVREVIEKTELSSFALANHIERYARGLDRERLLLGLKGVTVNIFTETEDAALWSKEEAARGCTFHPPVPFQQVADICRMSKVVINSIPHIRKGYHERLFLSLASGAVTLTGKGVRLPAWVEKAGRVVGYTSNALEDLEHQLQEAQRRHYDPDLILPWLETEHSWDARLEQHLPEIDESVEKLRAKWEQNPFWRMVE